MRPSPLQRRLMSAGLIVLTTVIPYVYYRAVYSHSKRLRVVSPGKLYRSGSMTAQGFRDAIRELGIRTVINLQDEAPDPQIPESYLNRDTVAECALCRDLDANFVFISLDLVSRFEAGKKRPAAIDQFLKIMDDAKNYPVLIHCRAGLHRTGCMVAAYRMEYEGWSMEAALRELRGNGFGTYNSTSFNDYITQYVLTYKPGLRRAARAGAGNGRLLPAAQTIHDPGRLLD